MIKYITKKSKEKEFFMEKPLPTIATKEIHEEGLAGENNPPISTEDLISRIIDKCIEIVVWILNAKTITFYKFENELIPKVYELGIMFISLFLYTREAYWNETNLKVDSKYRKQKGKDRLLSTFFGKVRYWRTYLYRIDNDKENGGYFPLDAELGLAADGVSMLISSIASRVATKMSYAQSVLMLNMFLKWSPAQKTIEEMVLGLGRHTGEWFENRPGPKDDGEVLVIQIDSKAIPTATENELEKRRGQRDRNNHPGSQRHRSRNRRKKKGQRNVAKKEIRLRMEKWGQLWLCILFGEQQTVVWKGQ